MSAAIPGTDREYLQTEAYADSTKLRTRASIYQYRTPPGSMGDWVLARTDWPLGCRVLDVGCGPGSYLALLGDVRAVGVDLSPGMAAEAKVHAPTAVGDAATLPFADNTFDRVLAPHMLYHCPDIPAAVTELRRVLRPGGELIAVTNDPQHLAELRAIHRATGADPLIVVERFSLANGADLLRGSFTDVRLERFDGELAVPDVRPVADYVESMIGWHGDRAPVNVRTEIERLVGEVIERDGIFRATTRAGAFICR